VIGVFSATGLRCCSVPAGLWYREGESHQAAALILIARVTPGLSYLIHCSCCSNGFIMIGTLTPL